MKGDLVENRKNSRRDLELEIRPCRKQKELEKGLEASKEIEDASSENRKKSRGDLKLKRRPCENKLIAKRLS